MAVVKIKFVNVEDSSHYVKITLDKVPEFESDSVAFRYETNREKDDRFLLGLVVGRHWRMKTGVCSAAEIVDAALQTALMEGFRLVSDIPELKPAKPLSEEQKRIQDLIID
jgi:hypothetical protein